MAEVSLPSIPHGHFFSFLCLGFSIFTTERQAQLPLPTLALDGNGQSRPLSPVAWGLVGGYGLLYLQFPTLCWQPHLLPWPDLPLLLLGALGC